MAVKERLLEFIDKIPTNQHQFEKSVGLSTGFVNNIGDSIRKKSLDKISEKYPKLNTTWLLTGDGNMMKKEYDGNDQTSFLNEDSEEIERNISNKSIIDLIETNKKLADAHYEMAVAHKALALANNKHADSNALLIRKLHIPATEDDHEETPLSQVAKFAALLEVVAEIGSGKTSWSSKQEALAVLNKRVYDKLEKKPPVGTKNTPGKKDTVKVS